MRDTIKEIIPETVAGLEIFLKECDKEIKRLERIRKSAQQSFDIKTGKPKPAFTF